MKFARGAFASGNLFAILAVTAVAKPKDCCQQSHVVRPYFDREIMEGFEPSPQERSRQESGSVTVRIQDTARATMKVVRGETVVKASAAAVWDVITDYDFYAKLFERMEHSETVLKQGDWEHHYTVVRYPWPWGHRWVLNTIHHDRPNFIARFKRLEGTIREVEGRWELRARQDGTSFLRYGVRMDPGLELVPSWVVPWATSIVVPDILKSVGKEAERRHKRAL